MSKDVATDDQLMKEFRERWQAVEAIEAEEQRAASIASRWRQLNAILQMAIDMGLDLSELGRDDDEIVWRRWAQLKDGLP